MNREEMAVTFRRYTPMVYRRALVLLGNRSDAEDAAQEVFVRVLKNGAGFEGRAQVSTWLYQITTNHCLDLIRARRTQLKVLSAQETADVRIPGALPLADLCVLRQLLAEADPREAKAAVFVFVDGMSHDEAAQVLGVSRRTVGNLVERFSRWARLRLGDERQPAEE